jgi:hypothetical protein
VGNGPVMAGRFPLRPAARENRGPRNCSIFSGWRDQT